MLKKSIIKKILEMKPFHEPNCVHNIFSWKDLENLINLRPVVNNKRFRFANHKNYNWPYQAWLSDVNTYPPSILDKELKKYTAYIVDMSRVNKKVNAICAQLESSIKLSTDAHIYFSLVDNLKEDSGFPIHWDTAHNLIIQIEGISQHLVWNREVNDNDPKNLTYINESPFLDVVMKPGDITFIPMKMYHKVISKTKRLSISFPMNYFDEDIFQDRKWINLVEETKNCAVS